MGKKTNVPKLLDKEAAKEAEAVLREELTPSEYDWLLPHVDTLSRYASELKQKNSVLQLKVAELEGQLVAAKKNLATAEAIKQAEVSELRSQRDSLQSELARQKCTDTAAIREATEVFSYIQKDAVKLNKSVARTKADYPTTHQERWRGILRNTPKLISSNFGPLFDVIMLGSRTIGGYPVLHAPIDILSTLKEGEQITRLGLLCHFAALNNCGLIIDTPEFNLWRIIHESDAWPKIVCGTMLTGSPPRTRERWKGVIGNKPMIYSSAEEGEVKTIIDYGYEADEKEKS